jgi:hypothetical protein
MTDEQILECSKVILNFLNEGDREAKRYKNFDTPSNNMMEECLKKYKQDFALVYGFEISMVRFCEYLNMKYGYYDVFYKTCAQEFFADDFSQPGPSKAKLMLNSIVRDSKLNDILC